MDLSLACHPEWALVARFPDRLAVLDRLVDLLGRDLPPDLTAVFRRAIHDRERVTTTALGGGIAIPHARISGVGAVRIALARAEDGVAFEARDGQPVRLVAMLMSREEDHGGHLRHLAAVAARLADRGRRDRMLAAGDPAALVRAFIDP
jgi:mannitol/fructose-specific phosphotransferase system IIA component (Ntr-type)